MPNASANDNNGNNPYNQPYNQGWQDTSYNNYNTAAASDPTQRHPHPSTVTPSAVENPNLPNPDDLPPHPAASMAPKEPSHFDMDVITKLEELIADRNVPEFVCKEATDLSLSGIQKLGHLEATSLATVLFDLTKQQYFYALTVGDQNKMWIFYKNYEIIKCEGYRKQLQGMVPMRGRPGWIQQELQNRKNQRVIHQSGGNALNGAESIKFTDWLEDASKENWFKLLPDKQQRTIWNLAQKRIVMKEYAKQKFISLKETVQSSGIPVQLIGTSVEHRQEKFGNYYAKLTSRLESYKQLMFDYDALCFIPDRNERIMNRLEVVRKNLFQIHDQMKRTALNSAYINKINDLLIPFEESNSIILEAVVFKELLAWSAIILKDATWSSFAEDALATLISDLCDNFQPPAVVLQKTDNSGYFKAAEFTDITEDVRIVEKIKEKNENQKAYGYPPASTKRASNTFYGYTTKMVNYFNYSEKSELQTQAKSIFKTYAEKYGIIDPLCALACSMNYKHAYEYKLNTKRIVRANEVTRKCHKILYGTELWDAQKLKQEYDSEADTRNENKKLEKMISMIDLATLNYNKELEPMLMDIELSKSMLEEEIKFLEDQIETQERNLALPVTETKYRESKIDEEPLAKTCLSLNQVLNFPDRTDRPPKLLIIARGIPGSDRNKIGDYIKNIELEVGRDSAATVKILSMRENKFNNFELETERDMVRSITKEHERLEETVIYDYIRNANTQNASNIIYVIEGVFYKRNQYIKISREAKKSGFTVLFASSKPPNLKDKQKEKIRNDMWQKKCNLNVKGEWKSYLNFLIKNFEPIPFEDEIALDVWEIYEDYFDRWTKETNENERNGPIVLS